MLDMSPHVKNVFPDPDDGQCIFRQGICRGMTLGQKEVGVYATHRR